MGTQVSVSLPPVLMTWCPDLMKLMSFIMELSTRLGWESEKLTEDPGKVDPSTAGLAATPQV